MRIVAVCGSFHKEEVEKMLEYARDEAGTMNSQLTTTKNCDRVTKVTSHSFLHN